MTPWRCPDQKNNCCPQGAVTPRTEGHAMVTGSRVKVCLIPCNNALANSSYFSLSHKGWFQ